MCATARSRHWPAERRPRKLKAMPELPEVETTRRGLAPLLVGRTIGALAVREPRLRWPVPGGLDGFLRGQPILELRRRAKYLLLDTPAGTLIAHLGMSGSLRYLPEPVPAAAHDHVDVELAGGGLLRYNDPRRFGSLHFSPEPERHALIRELGPEPLGDEFDGDHLWRAARGRRVAVKHFLMNSRIVAGIGNIYANEALYRAGIHPSRAAGRIARHRMRRLAADLRDVLDEAIREGGTTLRDFVGSDGRPGYFRIALKVYERTDDACERCATPIRRRLQGQRATFYCPHCQR